MGPPRLFQDSDCKGPFCAIDDLQDLRGAGGGGGGVGGDLKIDKEGGVHRATWGGTWKRLHQALGTPWSLVLGLPAASRRVMGLGGYSSSREE